jgi:hypothetical protein
MPLFIPWWTKRKGATQYKKLWKHFCSTTANLDVLITNHVLGICSCVGLLPSWVRGKIEVLASTRYMKWFLEKFQLLSNADAMDQKNQESQACAHLLLWSSFYAPQTRECDLQGLQELNGKYVGSTIL